METDSINNDQKSLKVMHVIGRLNYGGIETIIRDFARRFPRDRIMQTVCCVLPGEGALTEEVRREGVTVHVLPYKSNGIVSFVRKLSTLIKHEKVDIVHSHIFFSTVWVALASRFAGAKGFLSTIHNFYSLSWPKLIEFRLLNLIANQIINKNVCISLAVLRNSRQRFGLKSDTFELIRNGIDTNVFCGDYDSTSLFKEFGIPLDALKVGTVGSLREQKNQTMFLQALSQVIKSGINAYGIIVGDGPLREKLENEAKELEIENRVVFAGVRSDVSKILSGFDIFVLTSLYEGVGNVVLEAMASKLPVVVTEFDAATEIVQNEKNGFIVPINNVPAMAERILYLHQHPDIREYMGNTARRHVVEHFDVNNMIAGYERIYQEIAGKA